MKNKSIMSILRPSLLILLLCLLIGATVAAITSGTPYQMGYASTMTQLQAILGSNYPAVPEWYQVFNPDGTLQTGVLPDNLKLAGGFEAVFLPDNISNGIGIDMSALKPGSALNDSVVYNGVVHAGHDLGNAYFYATKNDAGHLVLYGAVERLGAAGVDSYVDFEFNQGVVQVWSGIPWPIHGNRTAGDLLIRFNFTAGTLSSYEIKKWEAGESGGAFRAVASSPIGAAVFCDGSAGILAFCNAAKDPQAAPGIDRDPVFDADGLRVDAPAPDSFLNIAIDAAAVSGANVEFSSIQVKTPEDIILGSFQNMGYWRGLSVDSTAKDRQ